MNDYIKDEKKLARARELFSDAFGSITNAVIKKSQRNAFSCTLKYPLAIIGTWLLIAAFIGIAAVSGITDAFYIVLIILLSVGFVCVDILLVLSFMRTRENAALNEKIYYMKGKTLTIVSEIYRSGTKAEWPEGSLYFDSQENAEVISSKDVEYKPYLYKNFRGHSRNIEFLKKDFLLEKFFVGCDAYISEDESAVELSSGFSFKLDHGILTEISVHGNYSECYENNFQLYALLTNSPVYDFRYVFTEVNNPGFVQRFPEGTREIAGIFHIPLPEDDKLVIPNPRGKKY